MALAVLVALGACPFAALARPLPGGAPEQRHVALGGAAGVGVGAARGALISWVTDRSAGADAELRYSSEGAAAALAAPAIRGTTTRYDYVDHKNDTYHYFSGDIHRVALTALEPETTYYYALGGEAEARAFRTPPERGAASRAASGAPGGAQLEIAVIGDLGQTEFSSETVRRACPSCGGAGAGAPAGGEPALAVLVGDLSYADGRPERWDSFGRAIDPLASRVPFMFLPGNHEIEMDETDMVPFVNYRKRYVMSRQREELIGRGTVKDWDAYDFDFVYEGGSSYYSFDVGRAHFVCLNTYVDAGEGSPQYAWLRADLEAVDRRATPWVFAFMHGPLYNSNGEHQGEVATAKAREAWEPLFYAQRVAGVFAGHVHSYQRTHPVYRDQRRAEGDAPFYVVVGDGGNHEGLHSDWMPRTPWSAFRNGTSYGHGRLRIYNDSVARWQWLPNDMDAPQDTYWITQRKEPQDAPGADSGAAAGIGAAGVALLSVAAVAAVAGVAYGATRRTGPSRRVPSIALAAMRRGGGSDEARAPLVGGRGAGGEPEGAEIPEDPEEHGEPEEPEEPEALEPLAGV